MNRTDKIKERLTTHFRDDLRLGVLAVDKETWAAAHMAPRYRYGWHPPMPVPDGSLVMMFSPDLMAEITAELDDDLLDVYLTAIETVIDAYVWKRAKMSAEEIDQFILDQLYAHAPSAVLLWHEVEARAVDEGIVTSL